MEDIDLVFSRNRVMTNLKLVGLKVCHVGRYTRKRGLGADKDKEEAELHAWQNKKTPTNGLLLELTPENIQLGRYRETRYQCPCCNSQSIENGSILTTELEMIPSLQRLCLVLDFSEEQKRTTKFVKWLRQKRSQPRSTAYLFGRWCVLEHSC